MVNNIFNQLTQLDILELTIIGESRGEPIEGQVAVGSVIRNRLYSNQVKYKSYIDVCLEAKQFSCWNQNDPNYNLLIGIAQNLINGKLPLGINYKQCFWVAKGIFDWAIIDNTKGSLYYLEYHLFNENRPSWARFPKNDPIKINHHVFFNL